MKFNLKALALTAGILCAAAIFITGVANLIWAGYGTEFLEVMASLYPGYQASGSFGDVLAGTGYALVDGAISALIFGWLYNLLVGRTKSA